MDNQRERVAEILRLLASKDEQLHYQQTVQIADVPAELICMWFNDLGEVWRSDAFSSSERDRLEAFNCFYSSRIEVLPKSLAEMHQSSAWNEVVRESQQVLRDMGWGGC